MNSPYSIELPRSLFSGQTEEQAAPITIKSIIELIYRRFWLIVLGFLTTFVAIAYLTFAQTPVYTAKSVVIVDTKGKNTITLGEDVISGVSGSTAEIDTEVEVMKSKALLTRVVQDQLLIQDPEFNVHLRSEEKGMVAGLKKFVKRLLGQSTEDVDPLKGLTPEEREAKILEDTTNELREKVTVSRVGTTFLINAQVASESPETAARLANSIADQYRVDQLEAKLDATERATSWLSERVKDLQADVSEKERRAADFRTESGLDTVLNSTLTEQALARLEAERIQKEQVLASARARYDNVQSGITSGRSVDSIAEVLSNPVIGDLKSQRAAVQRRQADLESTYGPRHPELIRVRSEAADIDRQIRIEVDNIVSNLEREVSVAQAEVNKIQSEISRAKSRLVSGTKSQVRLNELERAAETSRVLYDEFVGRFNETRNQTDIAEADARILSTASVPKSPSSPKTLINLILGTILGGIVGLGLALLADLFDSQISSTDDIERKLGSNSLGSVPMIRNQGFLGLNAPNPADFLVENPLSAYAESIRYLRAAIAFSDLDAQTQTVAITSSLPDEGKTSLTLSLGRMSAMSGSRTLVIDGDFRRRQLTDAAGLKPEIGFIEYLFGAGNLEDAIGKDSKTSLDILPLTKKGHTPHDVFGTRAFDELLSVLRLRYDLILIDTGPLLLMAEARVVAGKVDKTMLVVRWRQTTRNAAKQSLQLLRNFKADILGVTTNMVDLNRRRHHRDPGASYKAYRKYYQMEPKKSFFGFNRKPKAAGLQNTSSASKVGQTQQRSAFPFASSLTRPVSKRSAANDRRTD